MLYATNINLNVAETICLDGKNLTIWNYCHKLYEPALYQLKTLHKFTVMGKITLKFYSMKITCTVEYVGHCVT